MIPWKCIRFSTRNIPNFSRSMSYVSRSVDHGHASVTSVIDRPRPNVTRFLIHNSSNHLHRHLSCSHQKLVPDQKDKNVNDLDEKEEELEELKRVDNIKDDPDLKSLVDDIRKDFEDKSKDKQRKVPHEDDNTSKSAGSLSGSTGKPNISEDLQLLEKIEKDLDIEYDYRVADDIEEYDYKDASEIAEQQIREEKSLPITLERGQSGVFDLDELVILLENLGAVNIVTVPVPPEANFCDHMVVVSAKSKRHLQAINEELLWIHKRKKSSRDHHLVIEGKDRADWCAMDMGNIVLHIFYGPAREFYDIESLWTLGPDHDPKCQEQGHDPYALSPEDLFWLETTKTADSTKDVKYQDTASTTDGHLHSKKTPKWPKDISENESGWGSSKHPTVD